MIVSEAMIEAGIVAHAKCAEDINSGVGDLCIAIYTAMREGETLSATTGAPDHCGWVETEQAPAPDDARLVRFLNALANDCDNTDGWEDAAPTVREAAERIAPSGIVVMDDDAEDRSERERNFIQCEDCGKTHDRRQACPPDKSPADENKTLASFSQAMDALSGEVYSLPASLEGYTKLIAAFQRCDCLLGKLEEEQIDNAAERLVSKPDGLREALLAARVIVAADAAASAAFAAADETTEPERVLNIIDAALLPQAKGDAE